MKTKLKRFLTLGIATSLFHALALAECEVVDGSKRTPFDGKSLSGLSIEKKSLYTLNKEYPQLNALEKTFIGEVQTCTNCTEKYVTCKVEKND